MPIQHIYALVTDAHQIFYIGRTVEPKRRLKEHKRNSLNLLMTEDKYIFIRKLIDCGGKWDMQILATYTDESQNWEDYWIYSCHLQGIHLYNMRAGSIYTEAEDNLFKNKTAFDTPEAFFAARELEAKAITVEKKRKTYVSDSSRTRSAIGHVETVSPGLAAIRAKQTNRKNLLGKQS